MNTMVAKAKRRKRKRRRPRQKVTWKRAWSLRQIILK